jgi:hypothetical protein
MIGLEDLRKATKRMKDICNKLIEKIQVSRLWSTDRTLERREGRCDSHIRVTYVPHTLFWFCCFTSDCFVALATLLCIVNNLRGLYLLGMTTVSTAHPNDSWDQPSVRLRKLWLTSASISTDHIFCGQVSSRSNNILRRPVPTQSVPDDWDNDDDDEDDNQKIWEEA